MEDILALIVVLVVIGCFAAIARIVYRSHKKAKENKALIQKRLDDISTRYVPSQWEPVTPPVVKKRPPAMKKANKTTSYADTPMTSTSSTSTAGTLDFGDVVTGALVLNELFGHKSGGSDPIDFPKTESSSKSWGLDDSDSRKSISDSMDSSSSWSSSDSSSSDSGPSSDW